MAMRGGYHTRQRDELLQFFMEHPGQSFSAQDLISRKAVDMGEATVYRNLLRLCDQGSLSRFNRAGESACFQYNPRQDCRSHFHLMCQKCGSVIHMDCDFAHEMNEHLAKEHGFTVDFSSTMIYGICASCAGAAVQSDCCHEHEHI